MRSNFFSTIPILILSTSCTVMLGLVDDFSSALPGAAGSSAVRTEVRAPDSTCPFGGMDVAYGIDQNFNDVLDELEIQGVTTVCHGDDDVLAVIDTYPLEDVERCSMGGLEFHLGFDFNRDGSLSMDERIRSEVICNGLPPTDGLVTLVVIATTTGDELCPAGGVALTSGLDQNQNASLDDDEIQFHIQVCNGTDGLPGANGTACWRYELAGTGDYEIVCGDGTASWVAKGATGDRGPRGQTGSDGVKGSRCWQDPFVAPGYIKLVCDDGSQVLLTKGTKGETGKPGPTGETGETGFQCTAVTSFDSSVTEYSCTDGSTILMRSGAQGPRGDQGERGPIGQRGTFCTRHDSAQYRTILITCDDGTSATLKYGATGSTGPTGPAGDAGADGTSCIVLREDELQRTRVECADGSSSYIYDGNSTPGAQGDTGDAGSNGVGCTATVYVELGLYELTCADATTAAVRNGENGGAGPQGAQGAAGADGSACEVVRDDEIGAYRIVCFDGTSATVYDGEDGVAGSQGPSGQDGADGERCESVTDSTSGNVWVFCDDGSQSAVRNGEDGAAGTAAHVSLLRIWTEPGGPRCPYGGIRFVAGIDRNGDGELQEDEVDDEEVICTNTGGSCAAGYHFEESECVSDIRPCDLDNGVGQAHWDGGLFGPCVLESCNSGYHDGGDGTCITEGSCSSGFYLMNDGSCDDYFDETFIPAGSFERDGTNVNITRPMSMMTTEVTQGLWKALSGGTNPSHFTDCDGIDGSACPVEGMDWYATIGFANALSIFKGLSPCYEITGCDENQWTYGNAASCNVSFTNPTDPLACSGFRLPTEAEWEYAYRAGTTTAYFSGDSEALVSGIGWYIDNANETTHPVAEKQPNDWGLFDMPGNVEEWIWDWQADYPTVASDYLGPSTGFTRVLRGGFYHSEKAALRATHRSQIMPTFNNPAIGFRLTRTLP